MVVHEKVPGSEYTNNHLLFYVSNRQALRWIRIVFILTYFLYYLNETTLLLGRRVFSRALFWIALPENLGRALLLLLKILILRAVELAVFRESVEVLVPLPLPPLLLLLPPKLLISTAPC